MKSTVVSHRSRNRLRWWLHPSRATGHIFLYGQGKCAEEAQNAVQYRPDLSEWLTQDLIDLTVITGGNTQSIVCTLFSEMGSRLIDLNKNTGLAIFRICSHYAKCILLNKTSVNKSESCFIFVKIHLKIHHFHLLCTLNKWVFHHIRMWKNALCCFDWTNRRCGNTTSSAIFISERCAARCSIFRPPLTAWRQGSRCGILLVWVFPESADNWPFCDGSPLTCAGVIFLRWLKSGWG